MNADCISRLPLDPIYEAVKVCCFPKDSSNATSHWSVYGSFRLGSKAYKVPIANWAAVIAGGGGTAELVGNVPTKKLDALAPNGYEKVMLFPASAVARS